jgi:hypothetical protein
VLSAHLSLASPLVSGAGDAYDEQLALAEAELERLVRRLRSPSTSAWRSRRAPVEACLERLVQITAAAERRAMPKLPRIADHALADAMVVIAGEALSALAANRQASAMASMVAELREALESTR